MLLTGLVFQTPHQPCSLSLDTLQPLRVLPKNWRVQYWTQHLRCGLTKAEGRITALVLLAMPFMLLVRSHWRSWPPGHTAGSCPACCPSVPPGPFQPDHCAATLSPVCSIAGVVVAKVQDLALGLAKSHLVAFGPWIQPVQVPVQSPPTSSRSTLVTTVP